MNPVEEVALQTQPPLLEDVSIKGALRIPVRDAMDTLEEREIIEADFRWYRWSKFAWPWLVVCLVLCVATFAMTVTQQAGSLKALDAQSVADPSTDGGEQASRFRAPWGVPRVITDPANPSPNGGLKDATVAFRTAALCLGASAVLLTLWWLCLKPLDPNRTTGNLVWALLFAACAVMAFIALATAAGDVHSAQDCPWGVAASYAKCESLATLATVACIADTAIGVLAGACAAGLVYFSLTGSWRLDRTGWREQSRDDARVERYAKLRERDPNVLHVREVHRNVLLGLLVLLVLALAVGAAVLVTFLTRDHGPQDRGTYMYEVAGWSNRNTRLRYAWTAIAMLTILANLLPVSHRVVAYAYAFVYCAVVGMALTSFGLDLHEVKQAHQLTCPTGLACDQAPFIAVVALDMTIGLWLMFYVLYEYCAKRITESRWSARFYAPHEISKHDKRLDSMRPVREEMLGQVMTAKEYVYRYRHLIGDHNYRKEPRPAMIPVEEAYQEMLPPQPLTVPINQPHPGPSALTTELPRAVYSQVPGAPAPSVLAKSPAGSQSYLGGPSPVALGYGYAAQPSPQALGLPPQTPPANNILMYPSNAYY